MIKFNPDYIKNTNQEIFVFGSNLAGRHGAGAALTAKELYGAVSGLGSGPQRSSYAIPTKDERLFTLPIKIISLYVHQFEKYVQLLSDNGYQHKFRITKIGCGLAGKMNEDMCPLFARLYINPLCWFDEEWKQFMPEASKFWGTFEDKDTFEDKK